MSRRSRRRNKGQQNFIGPSMLNGYRASNMAVSGAFHIALQRGIFQPYDVPAMLRDPQVRYLLWIICAPIHSARWNVICEDMTVAMYIHATIQKAWINELQKILRMLSWGSLGAEIMWKTNQDGLVVFDTLNIVAFFDGVPLEVGGKMVGLRVKTDGGKKDLFAPRYFWAANDPEPGSILGQSRLAGSWEPWMEKRGKHGAIDIRRLWFLKNVIRGALIRHPTGTIQDERGQPRAMQDYARELVEKIEAGDIYALPNTRDEHGNYAWEIDFAEVKSDAKQLLDYPKELDLEILKGGGVMPEVVQASVTGSGWSGRSVPFLVWLGIEDEVVKSCLNPIVEQIVRPGVEQNFGAVPFQVQPISLIEKETPPDQRLGTEFGTPSTMGGDQGQQPPPAAPPVAQPGQAGPLKAPPGGMTINGTFYPGGSYVTPETSTSVVTMGG